MGNEFSSDFRSPIPEGMAPRTLVKRNLSSVADYIRSGHVNKVVFLVRFNALVVSFLSQGAMNGTLTKDICVWGIYVCIGRGRDFHKCWVC